MNRGDGGICWRGKIERESRREERAEEEEEEWAGVKG